REIELATLRADLLRIGFEGSEVILEHHLRIVQQSANQRALAVIDAAASDEAQKRLVLVGLEVDVDIGGDEVRDVCHDGSDPLRHRKQNEFSHGLNTD